MYNMYKKKLTYYASFYSRMLLVLNLAFRLCFEKLISFKDCLICNIAAIFIEYIVELLTLAQGH